MTALLSDPAASRAVLIGIPTYAEDSRLAQLPAVERNLAALRDALCDDSVWGLAPASCQVLGGEVDGVEVMRAIEAAVHEATDTLLVYYAGHGLLHPDRPTELHLALHHSNEHQMWRALPYAHIRDEVRSAHRRHGLKCAMVLDCCFSGAAVEGGMSSRETLLKQAADIDGVCVLTSSAATEVAYSLADEELSAFTGALLGLLRTGVPDAGPVLDFGTVHARMHQMLSTREHPQHPQIGAHNSGERIAVFRNPAYDDPKTREAGRSTEASGPLPATRLFGRDRELRELAAEASRGPGVLVIHGPPGVGKSALAAELYQRLTGGRAGHPSADFPLVLLDDVTDAAELSRLDASARDALIVVTSRASLTAEMPQMPHHVRRYALAPLEMADAVALLQDISGLTGHDGELAKIAELLSCFPLALRPIAARLRRTPPDLLLDAMRESDRPLQHLHTDDDRVRTAFTVSYEALNDQQRQVLQDCAGHPGPDFDRHSAAALCRLPPGICGLMLEELVDVGLLQRANGRYAFHDLYRSYSRTAPEAEVQRRTSLYLHLRRRLGPAGEDGARTAWRAAALGELRAAARAARADRWNLATELSCDVADALHEEQRTEEAREEAEAALRYATDRGDGTGSARARAALARLGAQSGPVPPADRGATRQDVAAELVRAAEAAPGGAAERGRRLMALAERALAADLVDEAMRFQAEAHSCVAAADDEALLAECLVGEAALRIYAGQHPDAVEPAQTAARLLDDRGDQEGAAHAHATAAEALRKGGSFTAARHHAALALERFETVDDPAGLGYAYRLIAKIEWALGDHAHARRLMHKAHELRRGSAAEEGPSTQSIAHPSSRAIRTGHRESPAPMESICTVPEPPGA
ncbi:caspase family protein [Streptomyces sp. NPDC048696]|uniref:caspase, EACC1-associated type n=1 Tax=Streptomyces sp. NPDC048696 TaxID=3365585 RepID=UPI00371D4058